MKLLAAFLLLALLRPAAPILIIDRELKKPVIQANSFAPELYFQKSFPIYGDDLTVVVAAIETAAKKIDRETTYETTDTIMANRTTILIAIRKDFKTFTVKLKTHIEEADADFYFVLVKEEGDKRIAQRKLLNFITYLTK